ncbi:hypothetical protein J2X83_001451 [Brevibacillus nitrificans]|nr:hypothetical protein [Brevibacillus nitrificans]
MAELAAELLMGWLSAWQQMLCLSEKMLTVYLLQGDDL